MRLSRLECYGFKSFAEKVRIDFDAGTTAIVGPNGCGKSNVADSIRWVLGESSMRILRGERLDDVIFKGTRDRKPLSFAEVTLSFEGVRDVLAVDYEDLSVTRRVFRDGVSDFLINKVPCRLKDITDLFLDTGVGKDAYSVMEFKMVEAIISPNANERRSLFEQAAGITRYKDRRKATLRKLDEVEGNLERLGDVIAEVDKNVRSLAYQVRKARRYRRIQAEILRLEVYSARVRWDELSERFESLSAQEAEVQTSLAGHQATLATAEAKVEALRNSSSGQVEELRVKEEENTRAREVIATLERSAVVNRERRSALEASRERAAIEIRELTVRSEELAQVRERRQQEVQAHQEPLEASRARLESGDEVVSRRVDEVEVLRGQVETLRAVILSRLETRTRVEREYSAISARLESVDEQVHNLEVQASEALALQEQGRVHLRELSAKSEAVREREALAGEALEALVEREAEIREQESSARAQVEDFRGQREAAAATLDVLRGLESRLEGYGAAVQELLAEAETESTGVEGVLAAAIQVTPEHEVAIENVLGDRIQAVLAADGNAATSALERVLERGWGRVALLDCSAAGANRLPAGTLPQGDGVLGRASDFVQVHDARIREVVAGLLEAVVVVDTLATAMARLEAADDPGWTYVTRRGEVVAPGGLMLGGTDGEDGGGLLGRRREIAKYEETLGNLEDSLEGARRRVRELDDSIRNVREETASTRARWDELRTEAHQLEVEAHRTSDRVKGAEQEQARAEEARVNCLAAVSDLRERRVELDSQLEESGAKDAENSGELEASEASLRAAEQARRTLEEELGANRLAVTRLEAELRNLAAAEERDEERTLEMQGRVERLTTERAEAAIAVEALSEELVGLEERLEVAVDYEQKVGAQLSALRAEVGQVQEMLRGLESQAREARRAVDGLRDNLHRVQMESVEIRTAREGLREHILSAHRIDLDGVEPEDPEGSGAARELAVEDGSAADAPGLEGEDSSGDEKASEGPDGSAQEDEDEPLESEFEHLEDPHSRLEELRRQLDRLGQVNVLAIEQHEEESKRLEFLETQRSDLTEARDSLTETIEKINRAAREAFTTTFEKIRINFRELFGTLFIDGDADVFLEEDVDPLEANIEIIARPGGKRPQRITLLSSGEKTMTAIALLFSLFRVRPSPFCLLDEIDAPLDDANVLRFVALLEKFTDTTQFLIITHNKRTMESGGSIFGVTMEEVGVSKIMSLRLDASRQTVSA